MKIAVFCGSSMGNHDAWQEAASEVGHWVADHGHSLVYGGSECGLMGVLANAALSGGAEVIGVEPEFFLEEGLEHKGIRRTIPCGTMAERKTIIREMSDAYIALPGGSGTLDEISEVIVLSALGQEDKPCVLYNKNGFYDTLLTFYDQMLMEGFMSEENRKKILAAKNLSELDTIFTA